MRAQHQAEIDKITLVSKVLIPIFYLTAISILFFTGLVIYLSMTSPTSAGEPFFGSLSTMYVSPGQIESGLLTAQDKLALVSASIAFNLLVLPGLWIASKLIKNFGNGEIFTISSVRYARLVAYLYLGYLVLYLVVNVISSWTPDGFNVSFNPFFFSKDFIVLGLLWLFVWALQIGTVIYSENEMTI